MGDIIGSRKTNGSKIMNYFQSMVSECNRTFHEQILSPLTITLGDEFQGLPDSITSAISCIIFLEEYKLQTSFNINLRFVLYQGIIDTEINSQNAHGMLGPGLTTARAFLSDKRRGQRRFKFNLDNQRISSQLNSAFAVLDEITRSWLPRDFKLIIDMINSNDNQSIGNRYNKNRTQIWKRRQTLKINAYNRLKELIFNIID